MVLSKQLQSTYNKNTFFICLHNWLKTNTRPERGMKLYFSHFFNALFKISKTTEEKFYLYVKEWLLMLLCKGRVYSQHSVNIVWRAIWLNWMLNINIGELKRYRNWYKSSIGTTARRSNPYGTGGTNKANIRGSIINYHCLPLCRTVDGLILGWDCNCVYLWQWAKVTSDFISPVSLHKTEGA